MVARLGSARHALRGVRVFVSSTHNAWVEIGAALVALLMGIYFSITISEWIAVILSFGILLAAEGFNTAIEVHMDLTSPGEHPYARDTKDIAAGAVFIIACMVFLVLCLIFVPKLFAIFR